MKGILMKPEMVVATLENLKAVTRRLMNPQPPEVFDHHCWFDATQGQYGFSLDPEPSGRWEIRKPKYRVREVVYVKEEWFPDPPIDGTWDNYSFDDGALFNFAALPDKFKTTKHVIYRQGWDGPDLRWRSAMFMPEWASRIKLEILEVSPERLQDITEEDAKREGVKPFPYDPEGDCWTDGKYLTAYQYLWNTIQSARLGEAGGWTGPTSWQGNPWIWRYAFRRVG